MWYLNPFKSPTINIEFCPWSLHIIDTLKEVALLIYLQSRVEDWLTWQKVFASLQAEQKNFRVSVAARIQLLWVFAFSKRLDLY